MEGVWGCTARNKARRKTRSLASMKIELRVRARSLAGPVCRVLVVEGEGLDPTALRAAALAGFSLEDDPRFMLVAHVPGIRPEEPDLLALDTEDGVASFLAQPYRCADILARPAHLVHALVHRVNLPSRIIELDVRQPFLSQVREALEANARVETLVARMEGLDMPPTLVDAECERALAAAALTIDSPMLSLYVDPPDMQPPSRLFM
jgi:hypothetical protein